MKLIDTCSIINLFENNKEKILLNEDVAVTSFNKEELLFITHRHKINEHLRHRMKKFFEKNEIKIIDVPVHPGNRVEEMIYVNSVSSELLKLIPDPSDAVLAACALANNADVITKDRHHLYTAKLENLFEKNGINVEKKF
ncbi:PIN domain-containing protein [Candidatus Woesearchaeota archaeon]|nr:PIN domain-containing protein [Candidatus Woesearchaeota archaeon]